MEFFERVLDYSKGQTKQFLILSRHFFLRLFINDVVFFEEQMQQKIIALVAILAVFSGHLANVLLSKYMWIPDDGTSWMEKCYFIFFGMLIICFVAVLEWDVIFLDSRDFSNLLPLPLKLRTIFISKFTSYFFFICIYALSIGSLSTFIFWMYLPQWQSQSTVYGFRFVLVHLISTLAACLSISFIIALLIGILMTVLGYRIFTLISVYIRSLMMIALVFLMSFFLFELIEVPQLLSSLPSLKQSNSLFLYLFPPMWFVGFYETLIGNKDPLFLALSKWAVLALIIPLIAFFLISSIGYRKYLKKMQDVKRKKVRFNRIRKVLKNLFLAIFLRNPIQRAVFYFFGNTIKKSNMHKMRLASYMVIAIGLVLVLLTSRISTLRDINDFDKTVISVPFILTFFLVVGLRAITNIPISVEANWIFKLRETEDKKHYFIGFKKGIFFFTILPLFVLLFIFYAYLWGWANSLLHCLYGLAISSFLVEIVFINYRKIPFACTYLPGKGKMHVFWIVYLFSFLSYVFIMTFIEYELLKNPSDFLYFFGIIFIFFIINMVFQNHFILKKIEIIYEEEPQPIMLTLLIDN